GVRKGLDGLEYLEIDGKPSKMVRKNLPAGLGAMDLVGKIPPPPRERTGLAYLDNAGLGAWDAKERLERLDREHLFASVLYPTLGILWEAECEDLELAQAYTRAYNRWVVDFCADSGGRLVPIAHISFGEPNEAARELERAVKAGCRGAFFVPFTPTSKSHAHPDYDPFWTKAQELNVPVAIHPSGE